MKPVTMFILEDCPYSKQACEWMSELKNENPKYKQVEVNIIDEDKHPDIAERYDFERVPTYFVNGIKAHEGAATKDIVRNVFEAASE